MKVAATCGWMRAAGWRYGSSSSITSPIMCSPGLRFATMDSATPPKCLYSCPATPACLPMAVHCESRAVGGDSRYLDETNTAFFFRDPGAAIVHAVVLQYTPVNTDILPTFVLLHLAFPGLLWLLTRSAVVALAASFLLYLMVQVFSWHVPAWPSGELYFNPLAWQVLFVFGAWCADKGAGRLRPIVQSRTALVLAMLYLAFSLVIALSWQIKALEGF